MTGFERFNAPKSSLEKLMPEAGSISNGPNLTYRLIVAFPLIMVNGVALAGQYGFAKDKLSSWHPIGDAMFAVALESIAIFLAAMAFRAEKRNDSALRLKLTSYAYGFIVGWINYSHWSHSDKAVALIVGMMSASSPFLWSIYSRSTSREILFTKGLIEEHSLRLGATRWLWHPILSFKVTRMATWTGSNKPGKAIAEWELSEREKAIQIAAEKEQTQEINPSINGDNHFVREGMFK